MSRLAGGVLIGIGAIATALIAGCGPAGERTSAQQPSASSTGGTQGCSAEQLENNRKVGTAFNSGKGFDELYALMHADYIQHNPVMTRFGELNGVNGREEFKLLNELISRGDQGVGPPKPLPGQPKTDPLHLVIADCDHVFVMRKTYVPDPQRKGEFYEAFDWDAWRIQDGKLAEHWDGLRLPQEPPKILTVPVKEMLSTSGAADK